MCSAKKKRRNKKISGNELHSFSIFALSCVWDSSDDSLLIGIAWFEIVNFLFVCKLLQFFFAKLASEQVLHDDVNYNNL